MISRREWRNRLLVGTLGTLVVSGVGLADSIRTALPAHALTPVTVTRIAGADRFSTARLTAEEAFPGGAAEAILARGDLFPDALAGSFLAGHDGAPILLTGSQSLHPEALQGLNNLGVTIVHILGSEAAISANVANELEAEGFTVDRIGGTDRYATAAAVATEVDPTSIGTLPGQGRTAFVASGRNFPDALAAGPISYHEGFPILLTDPDELPAVTEAALTDLGIEHVILVGGTAAVSDGVKTAIEANGISVDRRSGADRFATAANLADFARDDLGFAVDALILATGANFPDAVAAGPLGGVLEAPIVLTADPLPAPSQGVCDSNQPTVTDLFPMGSSAVVSDAAVNACKDLAEGAPAPPPVPETLVGYVWANDAANVGPYVPSTQYQFNSEGGQNTITRSGAGQYTVTFPGLGVAEGNVQVTAYGSDTAECHTRGWGPSGADLLVGVNCYDPAGGLVDARFTASFQRPVAVGPMAYLWANEESSGTPYNPSAAYQYNSTGASNIVSRTAVGEYTVTLPNLGTNDGHVQVTSYGSVANVCKVNNWNSSGADERVFVRCLNATGNPVDSKFDLVFVDDINLLPTGTANGFVWANDDTNPAYVPSTTYQFNSSGVNNSITRNGVGVYTVAFPGVFSSGGTVHVTAYGAGSALCKVSSWSGSSVIVRCWTSNGVPIDSRFDVSWTS